MKYYNAFFLIVVICFAPLLRAQEVHRPLDFIKQIQSDPHKGEKIYNNMCANCHAAQPMLNVGAPKFRSLQDWKPRQKKGLSKLVQALQDNLGIMPARGGCFECSDHELAAAIQYMLPKKATA